MSLTSCEWCRGPAKWTVIGGEVCYLCMGRCAGYLQLEMFEPEISVGKPTLPAEWNFPPDSEYVEHEGRESGPSETSDGLPF